MSYFIIIVTQYNVIFNTKKRNNIYILLGGVIHIFKKLSGTFKDMIWYLIGCFIFSVAVTLFVSPNEISPGGLTGISTALNYLFGLPTGIVLFLLNVPILILGFLKFGGYFIVKTAIATAMLSFTLTITDNILKGIVIDKILAAVFGGILMGLGLSIVLRHGATTGGIDILAKLINMKFRHLTVGRLILIMDGIVIGFAAVAYGNIESVLYSVISMYASSRVMDIVLYGADKGRLIYAVTSKPDEICGDINNLLHRGVTILNAKGGYTGKERSLLFCTVRIHEVSSVYSIIDKYDKNAFIVVGEAGEIIGEGFKVMN